jgi:hypothetical protein
MVEVGGITAIMRAMEAQPDTSEVQESACGVLDALIRGISGEGRSNVANKVSLPLSHVHVEFLFHLFFMRTSPLLPLSFHERSPWVGCVSQATFRAVKESCLQLVTAARVKHGFAHTGSDVIRVLNDL